MFSARWNTLTISKLYRKLLSALFTWVLFLSVYSYAIIEESMINEILFFLTIAGFISFIGIFGYGVIASIIIELITKKMQGIPMYIVKFVLYVIFGVIGSIILSNGEKSLEPPYILTIIVATVYFVMDELNAKFIYKL